MSEVENDQAENVKGRVLVVDDEEYNRLLLRDLLETRGHQVEEAANGKEALQAVAAQLPDIILLDIMMPGMDGFEVCKRLKEEPRTAHIPVLMITALREREDLLRGIELGANDFLSKPIDMQEVALKVRNGIYAKKLFDENLSFRRELEHKVAERTEQLRQAHAALEQAHLRALQQVRELNARDRLIKLQMAPPSSAAEAYAEIARIVAEMLQSAEVTVYCAGEDGGSLRACAGQKMGEVVPLADGASPVVSVYQRGQPWCGEDGLTVVPIAYSAEILGVIEVGHLNGERESLVFNALQRAAREVTLVLRVMEMADDLEGGELEITELLDMESV